MRECYTIKVRIYGQIVLILKCYMSRGGNLSGNVGLGARSPLLIVLMLRYSLHTISILFLRVLFQKLIRDLNPQPHAFTCVIRFHIHT